MQSSVNLIYWSISWPNSIRAAKLTLIRTAFSPDSEPKMLFPDLEKEFERTSTPSVKSNSTKSNRKSQLPKQDGKCKISAIM